MSDNSLSKRGGAGGAGGTGRRSPFSGGGSRKNASTMNNPEAGVLNSSATKTVAAMAFAKQQESEHKSAPAIATGYIPPVLEKHEEVKASRLKPLPSRLLSIPEISDSPELTETIQLKITSPSLPLPEVPELLSLFPYRL